MPDNASSPITLTECNLYISKSIDEDRKNGLILKMFCELSTFDQKKIDFGTHCKCSNRSNINKLFKQAKNQLLIHLEDKKDKLVLSGSK